MRAIAQQPLSTRQAEAVRGVLLALLTRGRREEFRDACRLARAVNNTPSFDHGCKRRRLQATPTPDSARNGCWTAASAQKRRTQGAGLFRPSASARFLRKRDHPVMPDPAPEELAVLPRLPDPGAPS